MVVTRANRGRRGDDDRRAAILEAAVRIINSEGVSALTTRRVTAEAGLPNGIFHYWFTDKQDLLDGVIRLTLSDLRSVATGRDGTPADTLLTRLRAIFGVVRSSPPGQQLASYELTTLALRTPDLRDLATEQYQRYREVARSALDGWPGGLAGDRDVVASLLAVLLDGLILAWLADPEGTPVDSILELTARLLTVSGDHSSAESADAATGRGANTRDIPSSATTAISGAT